MSNVLNTLTAKRPVPSGRREHLTFRGNVRSGRHGWLRLTPAYSLHVVEEILKSSPRTGLVLDPFSGTGTTALVATAMGMKAMAVDINPFLVWLGNLKLRRYPDGASERMRSGAREVVGRLRGRHHVPREWTPDLHQIEKWWDGPILDVLSHLFKSINDYAREHKRDKTAELLKIAFCRTAIEKSHASFSHQSMSFKKRDGTGGGGLFPLSDFRDTVLASFLASAEDVARTLQGDQPASLGAVVLGDARSLEASVGDARFTTVVTSPPYPNRMSYIRELRPYMYWLGYLNNGREAGELDWRAIGGTWGCATSNLGAWTTDDPSIPFERFAKIVASISADHPLLGRYVHKYFVDIRAHMTSLRRILASGSKCYYIVGNSKFYDTLLPVERIYAALFEDAGFRAVEISTLRKRNSKKELFEYVVSAQWP